MDNVKTIIREFAQDLINIGVNTSEIRIVDSSTSFGNSSYIYVGNKKLRYSDHSVLSNSRILNEMHIHKSTWNECIEEVEVYFFPERFNRVETLEFGDTHEANENKINGLISIGVEFVYINKDFKVSKRGLKVSSIRVRNKNKIQFIKKHNENRKRSGNIFGRLPRISRVEGSEKQSRRK